MFIEIFTENALHTFFPAMFQTAKTTPTIVFLFIFMIVGFLSGLLPLFFAGRMLVGWWRDKNLLMNGEPARAKILKIWDTGVTVNDNPQVGMLLEVHAKDRPVYQGEAKRIVSRLSIPLVQVGSSVEVRFDPQNPSKIAVVL